MSRYGGQRRDLILEPVSGPISASFEGASIVCTSIIGQFDGVSGLVGASPFEIIRDSILERLLSHLFFILHAGVGKWPLRRVPLHLLRSFLAIVGTQPSQCVFLQPLASSFRLDLGVRVARLLLQPADFFAVCCLRHEGCGQSLSVSEISEKTNFPKHCKQQIKQQCNQN